MKRSALLLIPLFASLLLSQETRLSPRFRTVYVTQMANELDQHLASRLTSTRTMWVVLDPGSADCILTDSLDDGFWTWLSRSYPSPAGANQAVAARYGTQAASRHRGTVFLVDPHARLVLWSMYELPRNSTPDELDRSAVRINNGLKAAFGKK